VSGGATFADAALGLTQSVDAERSETRKKKTWWLGEETSKVAIIG
jgi:hypothetical protein